MNKFNLPYLGFGLGLRSVHHRYVLNNKPDVDWFEIITENYMDAHEGYMEYLEDVRELYPLIMHGVSLSIGGIDPLNIEYLNKVKRLRERIRSPWVSDHLCYTGVNGINTHDLLPIPYTAESLDHVVNRIKQAQDFLGINLVLENPSTYLEFKDSDIPEWEFIAEMAHRADCGILLDINNVFVTCKNHGHDPIKYIDTIPAKYIVQVHLAGHEDFGNYAIDTHDQPVIEKVWKLYERMVSKNGTEISTMVEWDAQIPEFPLLEAEIAKAKNIAAKALLRIAA